jgi:hypothetical protein
MGDEAGVMTMDAYRLVGLHKTKAHPDGQIIKTWVSPR